MSYVASVFVYRCNHRTQGSKFDLLSKHSPWHDKILSEDLESLCGWIANSKMLISIKILVRYGLFYILYNYYHLLI